MQQKKPHILLLINDEHRPDILPIEGNTTIRTPTLSRFIDSGVYFRNAYTPLADLCARTAEFPFRSLSAQLR